MNKRTWPRLKEAERIFAEAQDLHGGDYALHSRYVAEAAGSIAKKAGMDEEKAYVLGLLHDIGRCEGWTSERHMYDGYVRLDRLGYSEAAKICITHGYMIQNIDAGIGKWDTTEQEKAFMAEFIKNAVYDDYDRLIQLCDSIADKDGFCIMEKRFVDVTLRYGVHTYTLERWRATIDLKKHFDRLCKCSIYSLLPGIERNTLK